jgi:hypothetical protein
VGEKKKKKNGQTSINDETIQAVQLMNGGQY